MESAIIKVEKQIKEEDGILKPTHNKRRKKRETTKKERRLKRLNKQATDESLKPKISCRHDGPNSCHEYVLYENATVRARGDDYDLWEPYVDENGISHETDWCMYRCVNCWAPIYDVRGARDPGSGCDWCIDHL